MGCTSRKSIMWVRFIFIVSLLVTFTCISRGAYAADDAMVTLDISPKTVRVGDIITLNIFIKHEPGLSLYLPDTIDLSPFDIIDTSIEGLKKDGGTFSLATFKMAVYKVGVFSIPNINLLLKNESERLEISTPERKLEVISVLKGANNALLDVYPPMEIKQSYLKFMVYVWLVSFVLIIMTIAYFKKKRSKISDTLNPQTKIKTDPVKVAGEFILRIFSGDSVKKLSDKEICENISFAIKYFLMEKMNIGSMEMTSLELIECLDGIGMDGGYLEVLKKFLLKCDLVKFANMPLHRGMRLNDIEMLKSDAFRLLNVEAGGEA